MKKEKGQNEKEQSTMPESKIRKEKKKHPPRPNARPQSTYTVPTIQKNKKRTQSIMNANQMRKKKKTGRKEEK